MKKIMGYGLFLLITLVVAVGLYAVCINNHVQKKTVDQIVARVGADGLKVETAGDKALSDLKAQCIMVLGCLVRDDGTPSPMLRDRLEAALMLYQEGYAPKILITGDNGQKDYNEIHTMYHYLVDAGVPAEDIFCDHAGFSTYESMYRADLIFQVKRMIVVTQRYHLFRSLYDAKAMGIQALGVSSDQATYRGQSNREIREVLARNKDFLFCIIKPDPTYGGPAIPITGPAAPSHDE
jgi:vancomycin permeability regulator SanA